MNIKNILGGALCLALFASCGDELDYREFSNYNKDYVFKNFDNTVGFVTNIYSYLDYDYGMIDGGMQASACDEAEYAWKSSQVNYFTNGSLSSKNTPSLFGYYAPIREANYFLAHYPECDFSDYKFNKDYKNQMVRFNRLPYEVRFLRAYYYALLVKYYGAVPFTTEVLTEAQANALGRTPAQDVMTFVVKECDEILNHLPASYAGLTDDAAAGETGRVTKLAVLALKARTLLYAASPLFGAETAERYHQAALAAKTVIDSCAAYGVSLGKYAELWGTDNWKAKEVIMARRIGDLNDLERRNYPMGVENGNSGNCPTQTLVDAYEMRATGKLWNEAGSGYDPQKPYEGRDPRFAMTIAVNGEKNWPSYNAAALETYYGGSNGEPKVGATPTGHYLKKLLDGTVNISSINGNSKRHSWVAYRLGEFYLNYAEAMFKYSGSADAVTPDLPMSAREAVNVIRSRADVNMPALPTGLSADDFWKKYQNERMVELAFEGHRYNDIRRWREGASHKDIVEMKITKKADGTLAYTRHTVSRIWDDKLYFWPISNSEMMKHTGSGFTQNPGY